MRPVAQIKHIRVMKKIISLFVLAICTTCLVYAQPKTSERALWKKAKRFAKELSADGWKTNSSKGLEVAVYEHYLALKDEQNKELVSNVEGGVNVKTVNAAKQWAHNNAVMSYAQTASTFVKGRIASEISGGLKNNPALDNFYAAYENLVSKEISGELIPSISIYRESQKGNIEYRIYFLVNEAKASESRIRALKNALIESEVARMNAEQITKFVQEGFDF